MANALEDSIDIGITVLNVAPIVVALANAHVIDEGGTIHLQASFTDPGILDTHTATINWGDGTATQNLGAVTAGVDIIASRSYGDNGIYTIYCHCDRQGWRFRY